MAASTLPPHQFYIQSTNNVDDSITLQTTRYPAIVLRTIKQEDEPSVLAILTEPENVKDDLSIANLKLEELSSIIRSWTIRTDPLTSFQFLVTVSGKPVGVAGFGWMGSSPTLAIDEKPTRVGAAGVVINPDARGHGYGFEALRIAIDYGLRELQLDKIEIGTISRNIAMRKLMENRFGISATVTEPDRFGNDLEWSITQNVWAEWLTGHM